MKVADFGLAICERDKVAQKCGTLIFMAPEIIKKKPYDDSIDIWAIGFVLFILSSGGKHPIHRKDMDDLMYTDKIKTIESWSFTNEFPM